MAKEGWEEAIKEKVTSLLEESMEKHWGITVPQIEDDITAKLGSPSLNIYIPPNLSFGATRMGLMTSADKPGYAGNLRLDKPTADSGSEWVTLQKNYLSY